jgi:hypothetical protein
MAHGPARWPSNPTGPSDPTNQSTRPQPANPSASNPNRPTLAASPVPNPHSPIRRRDQGREHLLPRSHHPRRQPPPSQPHRPPPPLLSLPPSPPPPSSLSKHPRSTVGELRARRWGSSMARRSGRRGDNLFFLSSSLRRGGLWRRPLLLRHPFSPHMKPWRWRGQIRRRPLLCRRESPPSEMTSSVAWRWRPPTSPLALATFSSSPPAPSAFSSSPPPPVVVLWADTTQMARRASGRHDMKNCRRAHAVPRARHVVFTQHEHDGCRAASCSCPSCRVVLVPCCAERAK